MPHRTILELSCELNRTPWWEYCRIASSWHHELFLSISDNLPTKLIRIMACFLSLILPPWIGMMSALLWHHATSSMSFLHYHRRRRYHYETLLANQLYEAWERKDSPTNQAHGRGFLWVLVAVLFPAPRSAQSVLNLVSWRVQGLVI